ncbi:MAG TPA: outer membrane beta-barrel protein [Longimicrobiales bacterium]|nr:outer membrane beta-barrel protein [Longimicrobiales bacterium]
MRLGLRALLVAAAGACALPAATTAQDTWISGWGGIFMDPGTVRDADSGTQWDFGTSMVFGATAQRLFGNSLIAGVEVGYSPIRHEVRPLDSPAGTPPTAEGRAHLLSTMAVGRLGGGGGAGFGTYLTGGIGAITYGIPSLDRWDPDLALRGGGGLEYRHSQRVALFVEWNRWWTFHQAAGVNDNTVQHSHLEVGARYGM